MSLLDMDAVDHIFVAPDTELVHLADLHHIGLPAARHDDNVAADIIELFAQRDRSFAQIHAVPVHMMIADAVRIFPYIRQRLARFVKTHCNDASLLELFHRKRLLIFVIYHRRAVICQCVAP